jgi:hypothetical protein
MTFACRAALTVAAVLLTSSAAAAQPAAQRTPPRMIPPGQQAPVGTAVLRGVVVAADTGAPIRRAQVRTAAPGAQETRTTLTDEQGRFELRELSGGRYTITASKGGFITLQYGQRRRSSGSVMVPGLPMWPVGGSQEPSGT